MQTLPRVTALNVFFRKLAIWCYFVKFPCTVHIAGFSMFNYMLLPK